MTGKPQYYIQAGVRRAVAAREAGRTEIPAKIIVPGKPDVVTRLALDQLHSPKFEIDRDSRYIRHCEYPTKVLGTEPPPIEVQLLGAPGQSASIPLAMVKLK